MEVWPFFLDGGNENLWYYSVKHIHPSIIFCCPSPNIKVIKTLFNNNIKFKKIYFKPWWCLTIIKVSFIGITYLFLYITKNKAPMENIFTVQLDYRVIKFYNEYSVLFLWKYTFYQIFNGNLSPLSLPGPRWLSIKPLPY